MPEGILPELLIVAFLVALVAAVVVAARRTERREAARPEEPRQRVEELEAAFPVEEVAVEQAEAAAPPRARPTLRDRLAKSRRLLADRLAEVLGRGPDEETWDELEAVLIQADVGVDLATTITGELRDEARARGIARPEELRGLLHEKLVAVFDTERDRGLALAPEGVTVWLVVGVNGTGKTTTIGKLAAELRDRQRSVALAAADTFRAAADDQLAVWAERAGAQLVKHRQGADPGAVAYDAYQHARARGIDVVIVDTAGRLHTKTPLMDELAKIRRVIEKEGRVSEVLLVIDATAGQNGLVQARQFADASGVTGIVLTKLDGTAKGGIALAIERTLGIPIKLMGVGEGIEDLEPFDPKSFVDALLA